IEVGSLPEVGDERAEDGELLVGRSVVDVDGAEQARHEHVRVARCEARGRHDVVPMPPTLGIRRRWQGDSLGQCRARSFRSAERLWAASSPVSSETTRYCGSSAVAATWWRLMSVAAVSFLTTSPRVRPFEVSQPTRSPGRSSWARVTVALAERASQ